MDSSGDGVRVKSTGFWHATLAINNHRGLLTEWILLLT